MASSASDPKVIKSWNTVTKSWDVLSEEEAAEVFSPQKHTAEQKLLSHCDEKLQRYGALKERKRLAKIWPDPGADFVFIWPDENTVDPGAADPYSDLGRIPEAASSDTYVLLDPVDLGAADPVDLGRLPEAAAADPYVDLGRLPEAAADPSADLGRLPEAAADLCADLGRLPEAAADPHADLGRLPEAAADPYADLGRLPEAAADPHADLGRLPEAATDPHAGLGRPEAAADAYADLGRATEASDLMRSPPLQFDGYTSAQSDIAGSAAEMSIGTRSARGSTSARGSNVSSGARSALTRERLKDFDADNGVDGSSIQQAINKIMASDATSSSHGRSSKGHGMGSSIASPALHSLASSVGFNSHTGSVRSDFRAVAAAGGIRQGLAELMTLDSANSIESGSFMRQTSECSSNYSDCSSVSESSAAPTPGGSMNSDFEDRMNAWNERRNKKKHMKGNKKKAGLGGKVLAASKARSQFMSVSECQTIGRLLAGKGMPIKLLQVLGVGNFAKVYKGFFEKDSPACAANTFVAVKMIITRKGELGPDGVNIVAPKWLRREVETSVNQVHPNIIRIIKASIQTLPYCIVLEYCEGGALHSLVSGGVNITLETFDWLQRMKAAIDIADGMAHLHSQHIVHRDLKSMNVLLVQPILSVQDAVHAKVADFGLARVVDDDSDAYMTGKVGSWYFMAPEIFTERAVYDNKVDVYSFAVVIYEMLAGTFDFGEALNNSEEFVSFASHGGRPLEDAIPDTAPTVLRSLMRQSWDGDPAKRPGFSEIGAQLRLSYASMLNPTEEQSFHSQTSMLTPSEDQLTHS